MATFTYQGAQSSLGHILDQMDAGTVTSVNLIKGLGGAVKAKMVKFSTFDAVDVVASQSIEYVAQSLLQHGPMDPATAGLYKLTRATDVAAAVPDATVHATLQVTQGAGGNLWRSKLGGIQGNALTVTYVDPGVNTASTTAVIVGNDITVTLSYAAAAVTATAADVAAAVLASAGVSARVTATTTGVGTTLAAAFSMTALAGGANQPAGAPLFKVLAIYRKRTHSKNVGIAPSITPRAVIISAAHATFLGL